MLTVVKSMVQTVASFAELHRREVAETWASRREVLPRDWLEALNFFLRRVSLPYGNGGPLAHYEPVKIALLDFFSDGAQSKVERYEEAWRNQWIPHRPDWSGFPAKGNRLLSMLCDTKILKKAQREMILDVLRFIRGIPELNLVKHSLFSIRRGKIMEHHRELREIRRIGSRSASSYLGDLLILYGIKRNGSDRTGTTQPVDRWVRSISSELGVIHSNDSDASARAKILRECDSAGVASSDFFAGARYLGANSPRIARILLEIAK